VCRAESDEALLPFKFPTFPELKSRTKNGWLAKAHGHDDVKEGAVDLEHAGAEFVNQLEEHLVLAQRVERVNEVSAD